MPRSGGCFYGPHTETCDQQNAGASSEDNIGQNMDKEH